MAARGKIFDVSLTAHVSSTASFVWIKTHEEVTKNWRVLAASAALTVIGLAVSFLFGGVLGLVVGLVCGLVSYPLGLYGLTRVREIERGTVRLENEPMSALNTRTASGRDSSRRATSAATARATSLNVGSHSCR